MPLVARWGSSFLRTITFLIIHRFLSLKVLLWYICFSRSTAYNTFQFEKSFWIWWKVLDTIILWQDAGPCCEQTHAAFEVGLSPDQGQGVYSGRSDVVGSSQVRLCHTCIIDVMGLLRCHWGDYMTKSYRYVSYCNLMMPYDNKDLGLIITEVILTFFGG